MVSIRHLKRGDLLLKEGDQSNAMYWVQSGSLRLYKKKGSGFIELGVIHKGELVGEMSFLDNEPRSASVEALDKSDVIEIPRGKFEELMKSQPNWLNSLVQTMVKRLRTTNNRLREIESASTVYVQNADGGTSKQHEFISTNEVMRLCTTLVHCSVRKGERNPDGTITMSTNWVHMYGGNIMSLPVAKVTTFLDMMEEAGVIRLDKDKDRPKVHVASVDFIERFLSWIYEENLKSDEKRLTLSQKALLICDMIYQYGGLAAFGDAVSVNFNMEGLYRKVADATGRSHPFDLGCFDELVAAGLTTELRVVSSSEKTTELQLEQFKKLYPFLNLRQRFVDLNEIKRAQGS